MKGNPLEGRTGLVTGANRGIGRAIALALAAEGMNVVATARAPEDREALSSEIESHGGRALVTGCDVAKEEDIKATVERAREAFGKIDFALCNAGVLFQASVAETSTEDWDWLMAVNLRGVFLTIRECLRVMPENGRQQDPHHLLQLREVRAGGLERVLRRQARAHGLGRFPVAGAQGDRNERARHLSGPGRDGHGAFRSPVSGDVAVAGRGRHRECRDVSPHPAAQDHRAGALHSPAIPDRAPVAANAPRETDVVLVRRRRLRIAGAIAGCTKRTTRSVGWRHARHLAAAEGRGLSSCGRPSIVCVEGQATRVSPRAFLRSVPEARAARLRRSARRPATAPRASGSRGRARRGPAAGGVRPFPRSVPATRSS